MDFFPPLYQQANYIDSGISYLDSILANSDVESLKTGDSREHLIAMRTQIESLKSDVLGLKEKIDSLSEFGTLVNETVKSVEQLKKFGNFLGIQFGEAPQQYSYIKDGSTSVIITEKTKTPSKSPIVIKTVTNEPSYREITKAEFDSLDAKYKFLIKFDDLSRNYYTLYNAGVDEFTDDTTTKYGVNIIGPQAIFFWEMLGILKRSQTSTEGSRRVHRFI